MTKRKCIRISIEEKVEILRFCEVNSGLTDTRIAEIFSSKFKKDISRRSINDYRKSKETLLKNTDLECKGKYRNPILKYKIIDEKLSQWIDKLETNGAIVNDTLLINKALLIAKENSIDDFKASIGWLLKFKSRHNLKLRRLHGESYATAHVQPTEFLNMLSSKISHYGFDNVYNADETGIFYKLIPSKSICKNVRNGYKILKDRISVLFCVNMSGTVKRKPLVIGKFAKPRCFKQFSPQSLVNYTNSTRAWMTATIFNKWLLEWDLDLEKLHKKVLLIIDNCPSHRVDIELKSIEIIFMPSNLTSTLQPLDQGIIKCFKSFFTSKKLTDIIERIESGNDVFQSYKRLTIKDAIIYIHFAWQDVSTETIVNCFKHAKWYGHFENPSVENQYKIDVYEEFIHKTAILDPVDEKDFNTLEYNANDILLSIASEQLKESNVNSSESNDDEDDDQTEIVSKTVTKQEFYNAFQVIKDYYNQPGMFDTNGAVGINEISKSLKKQGNQKTLDRFFIIK